VEACGASREPLRHKYFPPEKVSDIRRSCLRSFKSSIAIADPYLGLPKVDVNEGEIAALVARGYLPEEARDDPVAIKAAIVVVISDLAFELEQERSKGMGLRTRATPVNST
jgi:hypothetical protein